MRKLTIALIAALVIEIVLLGTVAFVLTSRRPPPAPDKVRFAGVGIYSELATVADELGFFDTENLDVEVKDHPDGGASTSAMLAGDADLSVAANFTGVRMILAGKEVRILGVLNEHDVFSLIGRKDRGIAAPADLAGKKIGVTRRTAGEYYLGKFLEANGMKLADVTMVDLPAAELGPQIGDGRLDAVIAFEPWAYQIEKALTGGTVSWSAQGNRREFATLYVTPAYLAEHPAVIERLMRALVEAERWQAAHPEETKRLLARTLDREPAYLDRLWKKFNFAIQLDQDLLAAMTDQARWSIQEGLAEAAEVPDFFAYVHAEPLRKADPDAVTLTR